MKKIFTLALALIGFASMANAATIDDVQVCKHSYVLVFDDWNGSGTAKPGKGKLFGDNYFLDVTGGSVATNKQSINLADESYCGGDYAKYAEYGSHLNSWRLKNGQDVIAMKVTAGSKIIILGQTHASRYPKITDTAPSGNQMKGTVLEATINTVRDNGRFEWVADDDRTIYIGSEGGDYYVSYLIVEANEAEGTPQVKVGAQTYAEGLWYREVTCTPANAYGMPSIVTYTTDGTTPNANSAVYNAPIKCYNNQTIKFQAYMDLGAGASDDGILVGADNEAVVAFSFDAPTITVNGADVTISSPYEGAKNYYKLNDAEAVEGNTLTLTESATIVAYSEIVNGTYATFTTKSTTKDVYVLNPIKEKKTITVSGEAVLDEEATAEAKSANAAAANVYKVENAAITADKKDFFVKSVEYGVLKDDNDKYQIDGKEVYLKMTEKTNITFQVAEGDSVDVVVVCSKNSCKNLNPDNDETVTTDRKCYVNLSGKTYGSDDITATHEFNGAEEANNVIRFGLSAGTYTFQKYSGTGNIFVASIEITPAEKTDSAIKTIEAAAGIQSGAIYNIAGQKVNSQFKGIIVKDGKKMFVK